MAPPGRVRFKNEAPFRGNPSRQLQIEREKTRDVFFDGRKDISNERLDNRRRQADEYAAFKADPTKTKAVEGITGLFQATTPGGKTLAEKEMELAKKYGPTLSDIAGDITYRGGQIIGALGEKALQGGLGFLAVVRDIINYGNNKAITKYNKLNDVEKEIFDNQDKHPLTSKNLPSLKEIAQSTDLINKAEKDALGLQIDKLILGKEIDELQRQKTFLRTPGTGYQAGAGLTTLPIPEISVEFPARDPVFPAEEIKQAALDRFSPEYIAQQKALLDELNISPQVAELLTPNLAGGGEEEFRIDPIDQSINVSTDAGKRIFGGQIVDVSPGLADTQSGVKSLEFDDILGRKSSGGTQVTAFNNPVNLTDVGQEGTTGETYGNNFAVFPNAELGIAAAKNDLKIKTDRYDGDVDKIIGEFSPREDNPDSFDNYVNFVKQGVGDRVDPGEENELLKRVIQFENKPDVAQQYLALVAEGGLMDKKMYGGIIASKK